MKTKAHRNGAAAKRVTVKGKRMVMLEAAEFDRLVRKADEWEPLLPERQLSCLGVLARPGPQNHPSSPRP